MTGRDRSILAGLLAIVVIVAAWFIVIQPKRSKANSLQTQITSAQSELSQVQAQVSAAEAAKNSYAKLRSSLSSLGEAIPADDDVPSLVYQLQAAARQSKVDFTNFVLTPGAAAEPVPVTPVGTTGTTGATGTTGLASVGSNGLPPGAAVGAAGLPTEAFSLTFTGDYFHLADFLGRIERFVTVDHGRIRVHGRLMSINGVGFNPSGAGFPAIAVTISVTTYLSGGPAAGTTSTTSTVPTTP